MRQRLAKTHRIQEVIRKLLLEHALLRQDYKNILIARRVAHDQRVDDQVADVGQRLQRDMQRALARRPQHGVVLKLRLRLSFQPLQHVKLTAHFI